MADPDLPITLPGHVATFYDDTFGAIAKHLVEHDVAEDQAQVQEVTVHVKAGGAVEVTDVVVDEDLVVPSD